MQMGHSPGLTGVELTFGEDEIIVSKTDLQGHIVYANDVFLRLAKFSEREVIGQPHNIIRHPDMPRCVFKLLWDTIQSGRELFAYVVNRSRDGDHYWVLAHVTPTFGPDGTVRGFHSNRRVPDRQALETVIPLYARLRDEESRHSHPREAVEASTALLHHILREKGVDYDQFVLAL